MRLREAAERLHDRIDRTRFVQFVFMQQWQRLRKYCRDREYPDHRRHPDLHGLRQRGRLAASRLFPTRRRPSARRSSPASPRTYFSAVGQLWGHPVYRWDARQGSAFAWWTQRMERNLSCVDYVRIDHFRGLVAYWQVPAGSETAMEGRMGARPCEGPPQHARAEVPLSSRSSPRTSGTSTRMSGR